MADINAVQLAIDKINTNIAALKDQVGKVGASVTQEISRVNSAIASLQQQIGSGGDIKSADLDPIVTQLNEAAGNLGAAVTQLQTAQSALDVELVAPPVATTGGTGDPAPTGTDPVNTGAAAGDASSADTGAGTPTA